MSFQITNSILFYIKNPNTNSEARVVITDNVTLSVLKEFHDNPISGIWDVARPVREWQKYATFQNYVTSASAMSRLAKSFRNLTIKIRSLEIFLTVLM